MSGWKGLRGVWPAVLVSGGSFAVVQFLWSNYVGPELVDIIGGLVSLGCLAVFCAWWRPAESWDFRTTLLIVHCEGSVPPMSETAAMHIRRACAAPGCPGCSCRSSSPPGAPGRSRHSSMRDRRGCAPIGRRTPASSARGVVARVRRSERASPDLPRSPGGARAGRPDPRQRSGLSKRARGSGPLHAELAFGDGHRDSLCGVRNDNLSSGSGCRSAGGGGHDAAAHAGAAHDDRVHAFSGIRDPLRRHRRYARPGLHAHRRPLSVLCRDAGLAGSPSPGRTRARTSCSAACRRSPRSSSA